MVHHEGRPDKELESRVRPVEGLLGPSNTLEVRRMIYTGVKASNDNSGSLFPRGAQISFGGNVIALTLQQTGQRNEPKSAKQCVFVSHTHTHTPLNVSFFFPSSPFPWNRPAVIAALENERVQRLIPMTKAEAVKQWENGVLCVPVIYVGGIAETIRWRDEGTGKALTAPVVKHSIIIGTDVAIVAERVPDDYKVESFKPFCPKMTACLLTVDSKTVTRGVVQIRGRLELLN